MTSLQIAVFLLRKENSLEEINLIFSQPERQRQHDSGLARESQRTTRKLIHLGGKYRQTTSLLD